MNITNINKLTKSNDFKIAIVLAEQLSEPDRANCLNDILNTCLKTCNFAYIPTIMKLLQRELTNEEIIPFLNESLDDDDLDSAMEGARLLSEPLRTEQLKIVADRYIKHNSVDEGFMHSWDYAIDTINLFSEPFRTEEFNVFFLKEEVSLSQRHKIAMLFPEPVRTEKINRIIEDCVQEGWLKSAQESAALLERELTKEELTIILSKCVQEGELKSAQESAALLERELTKEELTVILNKALSSVEEFRSKPSLSEAWIDTASKAGTLLYSKL